MNTDIARRYQPILYSAFRAHEDEYLAPAPYLSLVDALGVLQQFWKCYLIGDFSS